MSFAQVNVSDAQLAAAGIGERLPAFTDRTGWFDWAAELLPSFSRRAVELEEQIRDRKSTRLNSSHVAISYAVFCLKKKNPPTSQRAPREYRVDTPTSER